MLVAAGVADPGNLGALARSAEAAGARALCTLAGGASPWNEKALRGSMGSLLRLPVHALRVARAAALAALPRYRHVRAATRGGHPVAALRLVRAARAVGQLRDRRRDRRGAGARFEDVTIPMARGPESLNVTVAAALLLFAAGRVEERLMADLFGDTAPAPERDDQPDGLVAPLADRMRPRDAGGVRRPGGTCSGRARSSSARSQGELGAEPDPLGAARARARRRSRG